ncbi:hypothetical protein FANTH_5359 [Fusarium anthophilum]|uniref:Uncharacterized protein n=1 Tax=Fusarium anthophilum TaxID=48485 RepID=A0A8H4ZMN6_9HYPO|nr:hypothetical protein FANTH_5359 [Fusarium anthophilum]
MLNSQQQSAVDQKAHLPIYTITSTAAVPTTPSTILSEDMRFRNLGQTWTAHYTDSKLDPKHQVLADREFFSSRERSPKPMVLGLDRADHAVRYALGAGLIDAGWVEDLEVKDPSPGLRNALQDVSLISCTEGVSFLSSRTYARIVTAVEMATELREQGLVTERLPGVVLHQRRFAFAQEQNDAVAHIAARGLYPTGFEEMGYVCADASISRSVEDISRPHIAELVADLNKHSFTQSNISV